MSEPSFSMMRGNIALRLSSMVSTPGLRPAVWPPAFYGNWAIRNALSKRAATR